MRAVVEHEVAGDREGSVLLVSHGGPTGGLYRALTGLRSPNCGYCGLYCYATQDDGTWDAPVVADHAHLALVEDAERTGRNDAAEQPRPPGGAAC